MNNIFSNPHHRMWNERNRSIIQIDGSKAIRTCISFFFANINGFSLYADALQIITQRVESERKWKRGKISSSSRFLFFRFYWNLKWILLEWEPLHSLLYNDGMASQVVLTFHCQLANRLFFYDLCVCLIVFATTIILSYLEGFHEEFHLKEE